MARGRVIAITPDPALGKTLRTAMTAAGAEQRDAGSAAELGPGPVEAELVLFHWTGANGASEGDEAADVDLALVADVADRMPPAGHVIVILPQGDLATSVSAMQAHGRVAAVA